MSDTPSAPPATRTVRSARTGPRACRTAAAPGRRARRTGPRPVHAASSATVNAEPKIFRTEERPS
ncbi:hypothetical protein [Streptomyces sp. NPDC056061]|uniref:hypothetical protein n=1 Tax=Streptomyces sp. NPDC056061 TaxID=3345700 RepID=UPI0035D70E4E